MIVNGYTSTGSISITLDGVDLTVPDDMANRHRQLIADWVAQGNTIPAYVTPTKTPADYKLTKRQIKRALIEAAGKLDPEAFVTGIIANIPDPTMRAVALADWQDAPYYDRNNPLFNDPGLVAAGGLTSQQIDALWMFAKDQPA